MRNPLHIPRLLKDTANAIQASVPHAQQATEAGREMLELIAELREPSSGLSEEQRAAMRRRIDELREQQRRENQREDELLRSNLAGSIVHQYLRILAGDAHLGKASGSFFQTPRKQFVLSAPFLKR
jgi:hypothetical protein